MAQESDQKTADMILRVAENGSKILDTFVTGGIAYLGYKAGDPDPDKGHWTGALASLVALKLATGGNLAGGVAGTTVLAGIGISQIPGSANIFEGAAEILGSTSENWLARLIDLPAHRLP